MDNLDWNKLLDETKVESLLDPKQKMIQANKGETILETLKRLKENKVMSVPVYDPNEKKYLGFVDVLDLLTTIVFLSDIKQLVDVIAKKEVDWYQYLEKEKEVLRDETVENLVNTSGRNPWCPVSRLLPLRSLMDMFSKTVNLHRVAVVDDNGNVIGLITQSKVISYLNNQIKNTSQLASKKLKDSFTPSEVVSISADKMALDAYKLMVDKNVSGVAIVGTDGTLQGALTASDIKGSLEQNLFQDLYLPIAMYWDKGTAEFERRLSHTPVSCTEDSTVAEVLEKLTKNHIHRLFVVDKDNKPLGVLSLCDIISILEFGTAK